MTTILTFVGGGDRDAVILQTALAAALPLSAHLDCLHAHVPAAEAARYAHAEFASGPALRNALEQLRSSSEVYAQLAAANVRAFCDGTGIALCDAPGAAGGVAASFREEPSNALERLTLHASRCDLVVIGRARQKQGLAPDTLEHLVRHSGRPILVAPGTAPRSLTDTIMVCWKDAGSAAGALTAAAPLLATAGRVVFAHVAPRDVQPAGALQADAQRVAGATPEVRVIAARGRAIPDALAAAADACGADLIVMGAYGRSRAGQILFGSRTDAILDRTDRPILLMR